MTRLLLPFLLVPTLLVGGCGGGGASGDIDPATLIPADAALYAEAVVRPDGDGARAFAEKLLRTGDAGAKIRELIDDAARESGEDFSFSKDVDPWLGDRVAIAVSDLGSDDPPFVGVVAADDADLAGDVLAREAREQKAREASSDGVDYWIDPDGEVAGMVEGAAVFASDEKTFRRAVAAAKGDSLAEAKRYDSALDDLPDDRVGSFYIDMKRFFDAAKAEAGNDPAASAVLDQFAASDEPFVGAVLADEDTLTVETLSGVPKGLGGLFGLPGGTGGKLMRELPADAWAAGGVADVGEGLKTMLGQLGGALGGAVLEDQLRQQLGIDLQRDVFAWMGDLAFFARGQSVDAIDGGVVIEVTDTGRAKDAFPKLIGLARQQGAIAFDPIRIPGASQAFAAAVEGAPQPVVAALADDRVVVAFGPEAAENALAGGERFADSDLYGRASDAVGGVEPSFVVAFDRILRLVESAAGDDADFAKARPYLETIDLLAGGAEEDGDRIRQRLALRLR